MRCSTALIRLSVLGVVLSTGLRAVGAPAAGRPNFVFILTDDQRWDAMGVVQREMGDRARFPWLKTPNMDRLAAEGIRFRNAFVVNSLCAPSRASFLTGNYGFRNGIVNNHTPFPADNPTHATLLMAAGYRTGYVGKWHMNGQPERPGFDFSASFIGQGTYLNCPVLVNGTKTATRGWVDDVSTDYALEFLRRNRAHPFLLVVGYKAAHGPFDPPERHRATYEGETARRVPNIDAPAIYRPGSSVRTAQASEGGVRTNLGYFRCLTAIDDNLGRLLAALDELKLADRTMVIFAGDNGFYLGEHGLGDKRTAYDESLRIPLLLRYPPLGKGKTIDAMALNIDLAPTIIDYAGIEVPASVQGRSWRPILRGDPPADWRRAFFYCYYHERGFAAPMTTAVRTETTKLIRYPGHEDWTEVFDLAKDPYELVNLASAPSAAGLRKQLEAEYEKQKAAVGFMIPPYADPLPGPDDPPPQRKPGKAKKP